MPSRVEAHERDGEARPELVLELLEDRPGGDDEDPLAAPAADELGEDHADLERLAEADAVGDEQPRPGLLERHRDRALLVLELVQQLPVPDGRPRLRDRKRRAAEQASR